MSTIFSYFKGLPRAGDIRSVALWLTVAFVFSVPWENAIHIGHIGRTSKALGIIAFAVWALGAVARGRIRRPDAFQKAYFLFLIWNGLTLYWSLDPGATLPAFRTYTEIFLLLLMFWDLCDRELVVKAALQAYVLGAFIASGSIIVNFLTAPPALFPEHERISALGYQTDGIALVVAIAAPAAWYLAAGPGAHEHPPLARIVNYGYIPVGLMALVMTGTRGASLASIPTATLIIWSLGKASAAKRIMAVGAIIVSVVIVVQFAPRGPLDRIGTATTVTQGNSGALSPRWVIWSESRRLFIERPITGVGLDAHRAAVAPLHTQRSAFKKAEKEAHNTYLSVLVETGLVGFAVFACVLISVYARVRQRSGWAAWYWFAQLGVIAIGAMSLSLEDSKSVWIITSLAVASAAAAKNTELSPAVAQPTVLALKSSRRSPPAFRFD